jgi:hypothetical protein
LFGSSGSDKISIRGSIDARAHHVIEHSIGNQRVTNLTIEFISWTVGFQMESCTLDAYREVSCVIDLYQGQHDMTVRSVISLTIWSCIVETPCERPMNKISSSVIDIIVFVYIASIVFLD